MWGVQRRVNLQVPALVRGGRRRPDRGSPPRAPPGDWTRVRSTILTASSVVDEDISSWVETPRPLLDSDYQHCSFGYMSAVSVAAVGAAARARRTASNSSSAANSSVCAGLPTTKVTDCSPSLKR